MRIEIQLTTIFAGLLCVGSLAGCTHPDAKAAVDATPTAGMAPDRVTAGTAQRKTLKLFTNQPGRVEAFEETPLHSKLAAYVGEVSVDIGDIVKKGQVLLRLSVPELKDELRQKEAKVAQADAELRQAEARLVATRAAAESAQARIGLAEAGIGRTEGEFERWRAESDRIRELGQRGSVTQKLVDEVQNQFRASDAARQESLATVQAAKASLKEAAANVSIGESNIVAAQALRRVAQSDVAHVQTMLDYTEIKAPFDGVVTQRHVDTGHYVNPASGGQSLIVVTRRDKVRVTVDVPEMEAPLVDVGDKADSAMINVQSLIGKEYPAKVSRIGWSLDASNRSLRVEIDLLNQDQQLRPGMFAGVSILLEQRDNVLTLPVAAIIRDGRETFCCVIKDGKASRLPISVGLRVGDEVEIKSGVDETQMIVLARAGSLQPGQAVEIIGAKK